MCRPPAQEHTAEKLRSPPSLPGSPVPQPVKPLSSQIPCLEGEATCSIILPRRKAQRSERTVQTPRYLSSHKAGLELTFLTVSLSVAAFSSIMSFRRVKVASVSEHKDGECGRFALQFLNLEQTITSHFKTYVPGEMGVNFFAY